jgi:hypothetical protein
VAVIRVMPTDEFYPYGNTRGLAWLFQAGLRRFEFGFVISSHELSLITVCRLGLGARIATLTIWPW